MQCDPKNAILPANRAMAYLKTESWIQADTDCSLALLLDDGYVKAYQRRAMARKNLKEYAKALEDLNHVLLLEPNNKQAKSEIGELSLLKAEKERPKPLKENSLPASNSEEPKVKGMFVPKSGLLTSQLINSETVSKMDSTQKKTCIIDCAVGIKDLKQDRNKEPLETRLERDDVKQNFTKNYIKKEIVESNIVPKNSNVKAKKRNSNRNRNKKAAESEKKSEGESSKEPEQSEKKDDTNNVRNIYVVGQDKASESIKETVDDLMNRDYLKAAIFDGSDDSDVGVIVVPEDCHIPRSPAIIEPGKAHSIMKENPTDTKFKVIFLRHQTCFRVKIGYYLYYLPIYQCVSCVANSRHLWLCFLIYVLK